MSKNKPVPSQGHHEPKSINKVAAVLIILCFLGIMPLLVWTSLPESSPYISVTTSSDMVQTAVNSAGMQICSTNPVAVKIPGVSSSMLYVLYPSCDSPDPDAFVEILVLGFSSADAEMAAIAEAQMTYQNWQTVNVAAFMSGYNLIVVRGAPHNEAVSKISASLIEQGAVRIL